MARPAALAAAHVSARLAWLAAALLAVALPRDAYAPGSELNEAQQLFAQWMRAGPLTANDAAAAAPELARRRELLAAAFLNAVEHGPRPVESTPSPPAVAPTTTTAALRRLAAEVARRQQAEREALDYRARALLGLALIGDAQVQAQIAQRAADGADPLAPAARAALRIVQAN